MLLFPARGPTLTLAEAQHLAKRNSLELMARKSGVRAAENAARQAGRVPNPKIEVALEDFGRNELEVTLSQSIELGGRRGARVREARAHEKIAEAALEAAAIRLRAEVLRRFAEVVAARERILIADSLIALSDTSVASIQRRVAAGAAKELDLIRAETELQEMVLEREGLERDYLLARKEVALLWGDTSEPLWEPAGAFVVSPPIPALRDLKAAADDHPEAIILDREADILEAQLRAERAEAFPELEIGAGYLRNGETGEKAALVAASVSLPVFNRNGGAVSQKRQEMVGAAHTRGAQRLARHAEAERIRAQILTLTERIDAMQESILPRSEYVLSELTAYYQRGAVGILEVLEAQEELMERWLEQTDSFRDRATLAAGLLELTGMELEVLE
jgi:cobalt-zinc-cadmium efflux system outer membrane protein